MSFGASLGLGELLEAYHTDWLHALLIVPIVSILAISLPKAYRSHGNPLPLYLAIIGVVTLVVAAIAGHYLETVLTVFGSALVISAHFINRKSLKARISAMAS